MAVCSVGLDELEPGTSSLTVLSSALAGRPGLADPGCRRGRRRLGAWRRCCHSCCHRAYALTRCPPSLRRPTADPRAVASATAPRVADWAGRRCEGNRLPSTRPPGSEPDQAGQDAGEATPLPPSVGVARSRACASPFQSAAPSRLALPLSPTPPVGDLLESRPQGRAPQPDSRAPDRGRPRPSS